MSVLFFLCSISFQGSSPLGLSCCCTMRPTVRRLLRVCLLTLVILFIAFCSDRTFLVLLAEIAKKEIPQAVGMLHSFKNKLTEKRGAVGAKPRTEEGSWGGLPRSAAASAAILPAPCGRWDRCPLHLQLGRLGQLLRPPMNSIVLGRINACVGGGRSVLLTGRELQVASQHRRGDQVGPRRRPS